MRSQVRIEHGVRGKAITIVERRGPLLAAIEGDRTGIFWG